MCKAKILSFMIALFMAAVLIPATAEDYYELSHGSDAEPNYELLFDNSQIQRIDIIVDADIYSQMTASMVELFGEPQGGAGQFPQRPGNFEGDEGSEQGPPPPPPGDRGKGGQGNRPPIGMKAGPPNGPGFNDNQTEDPDFFPVTVSYSGLVWEHVGMRYKGNSTLRGSWQSGSDNMPLRFNFDYYEDEYPETDDQRFWGFKKMTFGNAFHDSTLLHDLLASDLFTAAGVPAARTALYEVYLDSGNGPVLLGLYSMIEDPADDMLDVQFGSDNGDLYKPEGAAATLSSFDAGSFENKTNESEDTASVRRLISVLNDNSMSGASWRTALEEVFDVDSFLCYLAVNNTIVNWDGYGGAPHNYYLYSNPANNDRFVFIPWDLNESFNYSDKALSLSMQEVRAQWPLINRVISDPVYLEQYYGKLQVFLDGPFSAKELDAKTAAYQEMVSPYLSVNTAANFNNRFGQAIPLLDFIAERRRAVADFLDSVR